MYESPVPSATDSRSGTKPSAVGGSSVITTTMNAPTTDRFSIRGRRLVSPRPYARPFATALGVDRTQPKGWPTQKQHPERPAEQPMRTGATRLGVPFDRRILGAKRSRGDVPYRFPSATVSAS